MSRTRFLGKYDEQGGHAERDGIKEQWEDGTSRSSSAKFRSRLEEGVKPDLSIILPVFNEAPILAAALANLPRAPDLEIILVDGGSTDATQAVAASFPHIRRLTAPRGRGVQMNAGARLALGEILVFLHIDTTLTPAHLAILRQSVRDLNIQAGAFYLSLTPPTPFLRFIAWGANWRCRLFGLPYGDQAIFVRRPLFFALGGFAHRHPEDLDLVIRLQRLTRLRLLNPPVASSGRRWLHHGALKTTGCHWLGLARHLAERRCTRRWTQRGDLWDGEEG
jgi:rSAM/selenodomain-associated transferase 2